MWPVIEIDVRGVSPERRGSAIHDWPFSQIPRIGEQFIGFGLSETPIEGGEVSGITWDMDTSRVLIFAVMWPGSKLIGPDYDTALEDLKVNGWKVQTHVPLIAFDKTKREWREINRP